MSMMRGPIGAVTGGETVITVADYEAAQKAVSQLIAAEVPAKEISIVGHGIRTVEKITGKLGYATAARSGVINGVLIGLFLAAVLVLTNPEVPSGLFLGFLMIGVAIGMCFSLISYSIMRRRRDYASVMQIAADSYEVQVLPTSLAKARTALGQNLRPTPPPVNLDEPPQYGERIPQGEDPAAYARRASPDASAS